MFSELLPLLEKRRMTITLAHLGGGIIRANVIPQRLGKESDDIPALTTPLSLEGPAEELEARLATDIQEFVASTLQTTSTIEKVKAAHQVALGEIDAQNKRDLAARRSRGAKPAAPATSSSSPNTADEATPPAPSPPAPSATSAASSPAAAPSLPLFDTSKA